MKKNLSRIICLVLILSFTAAMTMGAGKAVYADAASYTIDKEVIVDNENCTFRINKAEVDPFWGFTLKVFCENKTSDKTLMFSISKAQINGYKVNPYWAQEVAPGKKANSEVTFSTTDFEKIGITSVDELTFTLRVYDSNDWMADEFVKDVFTVYPTGLAPDAIVYPERKTSETEKVLLDNDDICFIIYGSEIDSIWGYQLNCYIENKTDKTLMFAWDDVSVNGFMIDPYWVEELEPHTRGYDNVSFSNDSFEENDIEEVEEIEFTMRVYDSNDWMAGNVYLGALTYNP